MCNTWTWKLYDFYRAFHFFSTFRYFLFIFLFPIRSLSSFNSRLIAANVCRKLETRKIKVETVCFFSLFLADLSLIHFKYLAQNSRGNFFSQQSFRKAFSNCFSREIADANCALFLSPCFVNISLCFFIQHAILPTHQQSCSLSPKACNGTRASSC